MRYQIPQFINIEDKVFGPFSFKQFVYLGGSAGLAYVIYRFLPLLAAIPVIVIVVGLGLALAFYKVNDRPFVFLIQSFFTYITKTKIYLWRKKAPKQATINSSLPENAQQAGEEPRLSGSKLKELSWSLDVLDVDQNNSEERP